MAEIFVSYKTGDRPRVACLVAALREAGLDVWWDQDIPAGGGWRETIAAELDAATLCVVAWSESSTGAAGRFVREEAERAAGRGAYLGVLIDPVAPPFGFGEWQSINLSQWNGGRSDPLLDHFVEQVRARLANKPLAPTGPVERRRRLPWRLAAGSLIAAAVIALVLVLLLGRSSAPPATPTAFVNGRLDTTACSWLQIASVTPAEGGERIALTGIASAPESVQGTIMSAALEASVPVAEIDVADVATGPPETCAELDLLRRHPWRGRPRLTVIQPRGALERTEHGMSIRFEFEVDLRGLPPHSALLGLDSIGGVEVLIPDLHAFRRQYPPLRTTGSRVAYESRFYDENQGARNVALILMTASGPIEAELVEAIGARADRDFLTRFNRAAQSGNWQFELALVRCGFEGSITRRQC